MGEERTSDRRFAAWDLCKTDYWTANLLVAGAWGAIVSLVAFLTGVLVLLPSRVPRKNSVVFIDQGTMLLPIALAILAALSLIVAFLRLYRLYRLYRHGMRIEAELLPDECSGGIVRYAYSMEGVTSKGYVRLLSLAKLQGHILSTTYDVLGEKLKDTIPIVVERERPKRSYVLEIMEKE